MPIGRCSRKACWAAAIDFGRAIVMGATTPGNSTILRTGTMIRASAGIGTGQTGPGRGGIFVDWWHGHPQADFDSRNTTHPFTAKRLTA